MNHWTKLSIDLANQKSTIWMNFSKSTPLIPGGRREIDKQKWKAIEKEI